jgi:hypothetical protein
MIDTLADFIALFIIFAATLGTLTWIGISAAKDGLGPEYLGTIAAIATIIWACQRVVGM